MHNAAMEDEESCSPSAFRMLLLLLASSLPHLLTKLLLTLLYQRRLAGRRILLMDTVHPDHVTHSLCLMKSLYKIHVRQTFLNLTNVIKIISKICKVLLQ
jgi:hypothetical protein